MPGRRSQVLLTFELKCSVQNTRQIEDLKKKKQKKPPSTLNWDRVWTLIISRCSLSKKHFHISHLNERDESNESEINVKGLMTGNCLWIVLLSGDEIP